MTRPDTRSVVGLRRYALASARPSPQCPHIPFPNLSQNAEPCNLVNNRAHSDDYPIGQLQGTHRVSGVASPKVRENTNRQLPTTPPTINETSIRPAPFKVREAPPVSSPRPTFSASLALRNLGDARNPHGGVLLARQGAGERLYSSSYPQSRRLPSLLPPRFILIHPLFPTTLFKPLDHHPNSGSLPKIPPSPSSPLQPCIY